MVTGTSKRRRICLADFDEAGEIALSSVVSGLKKRSGKSSLQRSATGTGSSRAPHPTQQSQTNGHPLGALGRSESNVRSDQIHSVLAQGLNRFEICQLVSKGVRVTHKTGARFEDTINEALDYLGAHKSDHESMYPGSPKPGTKHLEPAA